MTEQQPTDDTRRIRARAAAHEHGRPGYPPEAVRWLVPGEHKHVLEIGAGTGKLTAPLLAAGHAVHAVDREPVMLEVLHTRLKGVRVSEGTLDELDIAHRSVDTVVCSTAFTSLDPDTALPMIARALKTGGRLSVVWHERDTRIPWVRRLGAFLEGPLGGRDNEVRLGDVVETLLNSPLFSYVEQESFPVWQKVNTGTVADLVLSRSWVSDLSEDERARAVAEVRAFYADYGRGMDGMQLPYVLRCVRTTVVHQPGLFDDGTDVLQRLSGTAERSGSGERSGTAERSGAQDGHRKERVTTSGSGQDRAAQDQAAQDQAAQDDLGQAPTATGEAAPRLRYDNDLFKSDGTDTDMLLIDFR